MQNGYCAFGMTIVFSALGGCAAPEAARPVGTMSMPLTEGQVAIAELEGPHGAARYGENAVAIRLWPDSLDDGLAEFTVIVTNNTWNTIVLSADDIRLAVDGKYTPVLGRTGMLARLEGEPGDAGQAVAPDSDLAIDARAARSTSVTTSETGTRQAPTGSGGGIDASTIASAVRGSGGRRPAFESGDSASREEMQDAIDNWYFDTIEIYPGDTGTGGFSIPVPDADADFELQVVLGPETYRYPVEYRLSP